MAKLMIMESPHKAKTVGSFLGKDYKVLACTGHLIDLPKSKLGIDVNKNFTPQYTLISAKKNIADELKKEAEKADVVLLATDPDREGEAISWHLASLLKIPEDACCRLEFNSITKSCVTEAVRSPRKIDMDLVNAQQARRVLDRVVGYEISPILWHKIKGGLSAGRVQSAVTKMVVDREREIEKFVPEEYWELDAAFSTVKPKKKFTAHFYGTAEGKTEPKSEEEIKRIEQALEDASYHISEYKAGSKNVNPFPPFTTSVLQQDAAHKLGFSTKKTMMLAQQLYEGVDIDGIGAVGLVTYIRTDSVRVAPEALDEVRAYIAAHFDAKYLPGKPNFYKTKKNSQDAHEAIRPSAMELTPERVRSSLTSDQYKLYKLIFDRFVASQMASAKYATIAVSILSDNGYLFKATSSKRIFDGFLSIYADKDEESKSTSLPEMNVGDEVIRLAFDPSQHFTQPPQRYNEASLVKEMEAMGIGRPSTYASTVSTILERDYIEREKKQLKPTSLGVTVTDMIAAHFSEIVDLKFTANMESDLDDIEHGGKDWVKVVSDFYGPFKESLDKANQIDRVKIPVEETEEKCPKCGANMVIRSGRFGKFLACPNYPACKTTKPLPQDEIKEPCPKCGGKLVQRISKKGKKFYGCSNYPNCDFASAGIPTGEKCPECGGFLVRGFKGKIMCNSFDCQYGKAKRKDAPDKNET
ncbi:MAG: type I DNA topoisomerase [Clostridia bacterium]|nr:type I DNA topoisomerase [Clostridia bacterium]